MLKRLLFALPLLALACAATLAGAPAAPAPAYGLWVEMRDLPGDTIRYIAHWTPPTVSSEQRAIAGYDVEWVRGATTMRTVAASGTADSIDLVRPGPAAGDSVGPYSVRVRTRDTAGALSAWRTSIAWWIRSEALPPSPPIDIWVDTAGSPVALRDMLVLPQVVSIDVGATVKMCAYGLYPNGWVLLKSKDLPNDTTHFPYCRAEFDEYTAPRAIFSA